jgi:hypothetical protein
MPIFSEEVDALLDLVGGHFVEDNIQDLFVLHAVRVTPSCPQKMKSEFQVILREMSRISIARRTAQALTKTQARHFVETRSGHTLQSSTTVSHVRVLHEQATESVEGRKGAFFGKDVIVRRAF